MSRPVHKLLLGAAGLAGGVLCWALIQRLFALPPDILPSPWSVARALGNGFTAADADENWMPLIAGTFGIGLARWMAGGLAGIAIGVLLGAWRPAEDVFKAWIILFGGAAGVAASPVLLYWSGFGFGSKLLLAAWLTFFPVVRATLTGLRAAPASWCDVMRGFSASPLETLLRLRLPVALPRLCGALRRGWTLALAGVVIAEFLGAPGGLGRQILQHEAAADLAGVFAGLTVLGAVAAGIACVLGLAERDVANWIGLPRGV